MRRRHRLLVAAGLLAPACSPAPTAHRGKVSEPAPSAPSADAAASAGAGDVAPTTLPAPATTTTEVSTTTAAPVTTVTIANMPATTRRTTTTTVFVMPEKADDDLSDEEWWAKQPGFVPGACGGSLPPCWVMRRESGGDPTAVNATGCGGRGCFGKWQFDPRTSQGLGYSRPMNQYDEATQDEAARTLWAGGRGCSHWDAC